MTVTDKTERSKTRIRIENRERTDNAVYKVSLEEWYGELIQRYKSLQDIVDKNLPNL
jgi:hypothetical protein